MIGRHESSASPMRLEENFLLFRGRRSRVVRPCPSLHPHWCHFDVNLDVVWATELGFDF